MFPRNQILNTQSTKLMPMNDDKDAVRTALYIWNVLSSLQPLGN